MTFVLFMFEFCFHVTRLILFDWFVAKNVRRVCQVAAEARARKEKK